MVNPCGSSFQFFGFHSVSPASSVLFWILANWGIFLKFSDQFSRQLGDFKHILFLHKRGRVVPQVFPHLKSYIFCQLKPRPTFQNSKITPSGKKVTEGERRRREKNGRISGVLVLWQHTQVARTNINPRFKKGFKEDRWKGLCQMYRKYLGDS